MFGPVLLRNMSIRREGREEICLSLQSILHRLVDVDILLAAVQDTDEPKLERVDAASENVSGVGSCIHEIKFSQNANGAFALWINRAGEFERVRVSEIDICGGYSKNH